MYMNEALSEVRTLINNKVKEVFTDSKDFTECILVKRELLAPLNTEYTFLVKVAHDEHRSQLLYSSFVGMIENDYLLECFKTEVIEQNSTLKELFYFSLRLQNI